MTTEWKKEHFDAWLNLAEKKPAEHLFLDMRSKSKPDLWTDDFITSNLKLANQAYYDYFVELYDSPLLVKLKRQDGFNRAWEAIGSKRGRKGEGPYVHNSEKWIAGILQSFRNAESIDTAESAIFREFSNSAANGWLHSFVNAFHEYLFTNNAERLFEARKEGRHRSDRLLVAMKGLDDLLGALKQERRLSGFPINTWQRMYDYMKRSDGIGGAFEALPISRDSKLKSEQLFVYRMYKANRRLTKFPKPTVIADLMTIRGFGHQYDLRNLQRLCDSFAPAKKSL